MAKPTQTGQKNAKRPGQDAGGSSKDGEKKAQQRREAEELARGRKTRIKKVKSASPSSAQAVDELIIPTFEIDELINGNVATGHNVKIGDATFGVIEGGHKLTLVAAESGKLSKFVGKAPHVFITLIDVVNDDYTPRLTGPWGEQQEAMWQHIGAVLGEDGLNALESRLKRDRDARREAMLLEHDAASKVAQYVGEHADVWERAVSGSDAITAAFEAMTSDKPVEIRFNREAPYGVVLGFFFDSRTDGIAIHVGHVGGKSEQFGKILRGAHLRCPIGKLPDTVPEGVLASHFGDSVKMIHDLVMGLDRIKGGRDALMNGMYHAAKRIMLNNRQRVVNIKPMLTVVGKTTPSTAPATATTVMAEPTSQPTTPPTTSPVVNLAPKSDADFARTLREAGYTAAEVMTALEERSLAPKKTA